MPWQLMTPGTNPPQGPLVIDLAARTVEVDGKAIELPPTEFELLAALAARPGEVIPTTDLIQVAWPDDPIMDAGDLRWRIWNIRKRLGDSGPEHRIIGNRRAVGYLMVLRPGAVRLLKSRPSVNDKPAPDVIRIDEPSPEADAEESVADRAASETPKQEDTTVILPEPTPIQRSRRSVTPPRHRVRPLAVLIAAAVAVALLGGSWRAGYWLSQRRGPTAPDAGAQPRDDFSRGSAGRGSDGQERGTSTRRSSGARNNGAKSSAADAGSGASSNVGSSQSDGQAGDDGNQAPGDTKNQPPPPLPDSRLFHLVEPGSGEHYMTISSTTASEKQASGYESSIEGRVFSSQVKGTVAIGLDDGTAYAYRSRAAAHGTTVTSLYRLTRDGDFFYTTSSSLANQTQAQGWARSTAGYVAT